jgi:hypothetical protein
MSVEIPDDFVPRENLRFRERTRSHQSAFVMGHSHRSTLSSIQMLPLAVVIVSMARRADMPIPPFGEIIWLGASKCVIMNGLPTGFPRAASNRLPHRFKYELLCLDRK